MLFEMRRLRKVSPWLRWMVVALASRCPPHAADVGKPLKLHPVWIGAFKFNLGYNFTDHVLRAAVASCEDDARPIPNTYLDTLRKSYNDSHALGRKTRSEPAFKYKIRWNPYVGSR